MTRNTEEDTHRVCLTCKKRQPKATYTANEWLKAQGDLESRAQGKCKDCTLRGTETMVCSKCEQAKTSSEYKSKKEFHRGDDDRTCKACACATYGKWTCKKCKVQQDIENFSQWLVGKKHRRNDGKAWCNACQTAEDEGRRQVARDSASMTMKRSSV